MQRKPYSDPPTCAALSALPALAQVAKVQWALRVWTFWPGVAELEIRPEVRHGCSFQWPCPLVFAFEAQDLMPAAERALSMRAELPPELFTAVLRKGLFAQDMQPLRTSWKSKLHSKTHGSLSPQSPTLSFGWAQKSTTP